MGEFEYIALTMFVGVVFPWLLVGMIGVVRDHISRKLSAVKRALFVAEQTLIILSFVGILLSMTYAYLTNYSS